MSIVHISDDIKQEFRIDSDGKTFTSIYAASKLLGVSRQGLQKNCNSNQINSNFGQFLSEYDIQLDNLLKDGISDVALAIIAKYYAYKAQSKSKQAEQFDLAMSAIGIRKWIQGELGYQKQEQLIEPTTQPLLPIPVNQSKVFIVGDDNGVKALVPHDQIEKLLEIATLRKFKQTIDPIMFEGLDPACLALPLELIEALNEQLQLTLKLSSKKSKPLGFGKPKK